MERQYKDSGVEWIGKIPETWGTCKVSQLYNVQLGKMLQPNQITDTDTYENYLCAANVGQNALKFFPLRQMWIQKKERDIYSLSKGDLIVVEGGDVASCDIIKDNVNNLFFQNALHRVRAKKGYTVDYLRYVLMTAKAVGYIDLICNKATISHFTKEKFENLVIPISHISEQQRIADYLDEKCGEIDSLIGLQEQMIEKLKAYKQSVITEAVTKGLNPNAKLVPSGIDWIGEIPEGWKVTRMKFLGTFQNGLTYTPYDVCGAEGVLVLRSSNIQEAKLTFDDNVFVTKAPEELMVKKGDIIICSRNGSASLVGKCALVEEDILNCSFGAFMVRFRSVISQKFAFYLVSTVIPQYKQLFTTTTINQLTKGMLSSMMGVLPPMDEQQAVASYLDSKCFDIDRLIALKQQKIESLKDYKKSVIYEAVTGKTIIE